MPALFYPDRLVSLHDRAEQYFSGRVAEVTLPLFSEYAECHYERFRTEWAPGNSSEAKAYAAFMADAPSVAYAPVVSSEVLRGTDAAWSAIRGVARWRIAKIGASSLQAAVSKPEQESLKKDMAEAAVVAVGDVEIEGIGDANAKEIARLVRRSMEGIHVNLGPLWNYGTAVIEGAKEWWNKREVSWQDLLDYIDKEAFIAMRHWEKDVYRTSVIEPSRRWAFKRVFEQVQDIGVAQEWYVYQSGGRLPWVDSEKRRLLIPLIYSDIGDHDINNNMEHAIFRNWIFRYYNIYDTYYNLNKKTGKKKMGKTDLRAHVASVHEECHGYIIRRRSNKSGSVSVENPSCAQ